jgi:carbon-monoxide dehydrogenase medium subunit
VTHANIEDGVHAALVGHPIQNVARDIAYRAVRNRGTLGGSLAHADPAADWVVVMTALDAHINIISNHSERTISIHDFIHGAYTTDLADNELISSVTIPTMASDLRWAYVKFCRKPGEFAHASAAVRFEASTRTARIVLGALDGAPRSLHDLAVTIAKGEMQAATRANLIAAVQQFVLPSDAIQVKLHAVALERALQQIGVTAGAGT